jgi:DNA-binding response OmpR family regulator
VYQAASRSSSRVDPAVTDTVRVVLVFDVPIASVELPARTVQLADEFGRLIARSIPGVRVRKAVIAPSAPPTRPTLERTRGLTIDRADRRVRIDGRPVHLTYREFELLCYLVGRPRRAVSRAELVSNVWHDRRPGVPLNNSHRTVDTHVRRLRAKLGPYARVLTTIRGRGYRFDPAGDVDYRDRHVVGGDVRPA